MKRALAVAGLSLLLGLLLPGAGSAPAEEADGGYALAYAAPDAVPELPPNLTIAKGLPPEREAGLPALKRIWESYRTPAQRLISTRSRNMPGPAPAPEPAFRE